LIDSDFDFGDDIELVPANTVAARVPTSRREAREMALKAAYALEIRGCTPKEVLTDPLVTENIVPPAYTVRLLKHIEEHRERLDDLIREKVEKWEFHRIAIIDRLILRLAVAELLYFQDVPPKVSINEAIEISKKFSTEQSGRFINGILDAVYTDLSRGKLALNGKFRSNGGDSKNA
jgi:transcription antitermination factor NusB